MGVRLSTCSIAGAHTARSVSARHAQSSYQSTKRTMGRSLGSPCLAACITSIIWRHDASDKVFVPYNCRGYRNRQLALALHGLSLLDYRRQGFLSGPCYSITWSASNWSELGTVRPREAAVLRLMTSSYLSGS